jgi:hypothetical protein
MLWTLLAIGTCELVVVHLLIALWSPAFALGVSIVSLVALLWLIRGIRSLATLPNRIEGDRLILRAGRLRSVTVPLAAIAGVRGEATRAEAKARHVLNLALIAHPNVMIDLRAPIIRRGRSVTTLAHRLDDPVTFVAALDAARAP